MLRAFPALLLLATLAPLASADVDRPCQNGFCEVGPCLVGSSPYWPGYAFLLTCRDYSGDEMIFVADYTCDGGLNGIGLRVYGTGWDCLTPRSLLEQILPQTLA